MRVFVLGAGASIHAGYPLAATLGNSLAAWVKTLPREHQYRFRLKQVRDLYGGLGNFESVLADLMTAAPGSSAAGLGVDRAHLLGDLKEAVRDYFDVVRSAPTPLYDQLARILRPGDFVITFNYDLGIERALSSAGLWDIKTGYGFAVGDDPEGKSPVEILKLHGSTNWRALLFGGRSGFFVGNGTSLGYRPVFPFRPDLEYLGSRDLVDPLCAHLATTYSLPAMIMPALPKTFYFQTTFGEEWKDFWNGLWWRAAHAIASADQIVVIGYSLPTVDERARTMLLHNTNKDACLTVCCADGTEKIGQEFRDEGFTWVQTGTPTFDKFLTHETVGCTDHDTAVARRTKTLPRLNALTGKQGIVMIPFAGEVGFTFLSAEPGPGLPTETDDAAIQSAIDRSRFLVRFEEGTLIGGSNTMVVSGRDICLIRGRY